MNAPPQLTLTAYEVRHIVQPLALELRDPVAILNEYLIDEIEKAMTKEPDEMQSHLVSLHSYLNTRPEMH